MGLEKVGENQNIEICKPSTGRWLQGRLRLLFSCRIPRSPGTPHVPGSAVRGKSQK